MDPNNTANSQPPLRCFASLPKANNGNSEKKQNRQPPNPIRPKRSSLKNTCGDKNSNEKTSGKTSFRIFVGGITCKTKQSKIEEIFSQFGKIQEIRMAKSGNGGSKGYCFIRFLSRQAVEKACNFGNIWLQNRLLSIRRAQLGSTLSKNMQTKLQSRLTVFNLPLNLTKGQEKQLQEYFSSIGNLTYYYVTKINLSRLTNQEVISFYGNIDERRNCEIKVVLLNLSYSDQKITERLVSAKEIQLGDMLLKTSQFSKNSPVKESNKQARKQKQCSNHPHKRRAPHHVIRKSGKMKVKDKVSPLIQVQPGFQKRHNSGFQPINIKTESANFSHRINSRNPQASRAQLSRDKKNALPPTTGPNNDTLPYFNKFRAIEHAEQWIEPLNKSTESNYHDLSYSTGKVSNRIRFTKKPKPQKLHNYNYQNMQNEQVPQLSNTYHNCASTQNRPSILKKYPRPSHQEAVQTIHLQDGDHRTDPLSENTPHFNPSFFTGHQHQFHQRNSFKTKQSNSLSQILGLSKKLLHRARNLKFNHSYKL